MLSGPVALWAVGATHPQPPWQDTATFTSAYHRVQAMPYAMGLMLVAGFIGLVATLTAQLPARLQARKYVAIALSAAFAAMIFTNYAIQTAVIPAIVHSRSASDAPILAALTMANPHSIGWALEMWGYGLLGAATWLCAPAFSGGGVNRLARALYRSNGALSLAGVVATVVAPGWVASTAGMVGYGAWNALVVVLTATTIRAASAGRTA